MPNPDLRPQLGHPVHGVRGNGEEQNPPLADLPLAHPQREERAKDAYAPGK